MTCSAGDDRLRPSLALLHNTGRPIVGGVETVMVERARLFAAMGYPTTVVVGRGDTTELNGAVRVEVVPNMASRRPDPLSMASGSDPIYLQLIFSPGAIASKGPWPGAAADGCLHRPQQPESALQPAADRCDTPSGGAALAIMLSSFRWPGAY
jgi:hypothetical protein